MNVTAAFLPRLLCIMVVKQAAKSLSFQLHSLCQLSEKSVSGLSFLFVENSSTDRTPDIIRAFLEHNEGYFVNLGTQYSPSSLGRIERISAARNVAKRFSRFCRFDFALIIDADVYFSVDTIDQLIRYSTETKSDMHCAFGVASIKSEQHGQTLFEVYGHYYDTATFIPKGSVRSHWPHCIFEGCRVCSSPYADIRLPAQGGILEVAAAFGGVAIVSRRVMLDNDVYWEPASVGGSPLNEHLGFISRLRDKFGSAITIDLDARVYWDQTTLDL